MQFRHRHLPWVTPPALAASYTLPARTVTSARGWVVGAGTPRNPLDKSRSPSKNSGVVVLAFPLITTCLKRRAGFFALSLFSSIVQATTCGRYIDDIDNSQTCYSQGHGNFDIILDQISRVFQLRPTPYAPCDMLYSVPKLTGC